MTDRYQALRDAIEAAAVNQSLTAPSLMQVRHLWDESTTHCGGDGLEAMQHFAQTVLARYGIPQPSPRVIADPDTIRAPLGERDALREALEWYSAQAKRMGNAAIRQDSQAMLAMMKEIAVDYGGRARKALNPQVDTTGSQP